ncbi:MAG: hypothetical protein HUJ96_03110 [Marinilabiliaceae bacterium]|nr:hypothetical protein [Marinilabiliaceae bacterium]
MNDSCKNISNPVASNDSSNSQKRDRKEWTIMNLFAQKFKDFPLRAKISKSERPDFIIATPKERIGVELTELKYERLETEFNMRAHEDFLNQIMDTALEIYELRSQRDSNLPLVVDVRFSETISPQVAPTGKEEIERADLLQLGLAEKISHIVSENIPESTGKQYIVDRTSKYGDLNLPQLVERISITNVSGRLPEALWYASISTRVKPLSIESITQRIKDKDNKLKGYDSSCDKQWLIIIQNSFLMSSQYDPIAVSRALRHNYPTNFDRVFVFERSQASVSELKILSIN